MEYFPYAKEMHDCLTALRDKVRGQEESLSKLTEKLGVDYDRVNARCPKHHLMTVYRGPVVNIGGFPRCKCGAKHLEKHEFYYHCRVCDEDGTLTADACQHNLCRACALIRAGILERSDRFKIHNEGKCEMVRQASKYYEKWTCDGKN